MPVETGNDEIEHKIPTFKVLQSALRLSKCTQDENHRSGSASRQATSVGTLPSKDARD